MSNMNPPTNKTEAAASTVKLNAKIKETWGRLNDDDIKLYDSNRTQFFAKLKEKQNVSKEDAEKQLMTLVKDCGSASNTDKPKTTKAA